MACIDLTLTDSDEDDIRAPLARDERPTAPAHLSGAGAPSQELRTAADAGQPKKTDAKSCKGGRVSIWDMLDSDVEIPADFGASQRAVPDTAGQQDQLQALPRPVSSPRRRPQAHAHGTAGRAAPLGMRRVEDVAEPLGRPPRPAVLPVDDQAVLEEAAQRKADDAADRACAQGNNEREVARIRKAALRDARKELKDAFKQEQKAKKQADRNAQKAAQVEQKAAQKAAKQSEKELTRCVKRIMPQRALSGGGSDPIKHMLLLLSPRLMEADWVPALLASLQTHGIEYRTMDSLQPLASEYAFVRFVRRVPRQAAALLCGSQLLNGGDAPAIDEGSEALQPLSLPDLVDPSLVPLAFPLVLLFVKPQQLVEALPPAHAVPGAPHKLSYTAQAPRAADPGTAHIGLPALQTRFAQHYSQCTLTVACVGLDKALMLMERAPHSTFNSGVVRNQLLDVQLAHPALRLREDLLDGGMACDLIVNTARCLAQHHKKQQTDGYLDSHSQSSVSARHPGLTEATPGQRTLALALGHLVAPQRAVSLATQHTSIPGLIKLLTNPALGPRGREEALVTQGAACRQTVGKISSKAVHDFFTQTNPDAPCRGEAAGKT